MKTKRSLLTRALQERFIPILLKNGFTQSKLTGVDAASGTIRRAFPFGYMKRPKGADLELLDIQMHPRGKLKFVLNFGVAPPEGVELPWAKLSQHEVTASGLLRSCRLYDSRFYWRMKWFSVSRPSQPKGIEARINKTVDRLVELYPEVEEWFSTRREGPHIRCVESHFPSSGDGDGLVMGTSYIAPVKRKIQKNCSFIITASCKTPLISETLFPWNPIKDLSLIRRFSRPRRTLNLSVIIIRCATRSGIGE
jgi:hypothetical protein